jgi:predicted acylesterase/phospholipase RssA
VRIGVAISGGGHRATAWGAGTLLALSDAGLGSEICSVSSVSGGSITNGVVAHDLDLTEAPPEAVERSLGRLLRHLTGEGLFWFGAPTDGWLRAFLAAAVLAAGSVIGLAAAFLLAGREVSPLWLLLLGVVGVVVGLVLQQKLTATGMPAPLRRLLLVLLVFLGVPGAVLTAITTWAHGWWLPVAALVAAVLASLAVWVFLRVFRSRGDVVARGLDTAHFSSSGRPVALKDVDRPRVHHVFCATDLQSGDAVYLTPRLVSGYRLGFGTPGDLPLAVAVQCSACLPGAFPPRVIDNTGNRQFHFERQYDTTRPGFPPKVDRLVVNDGGVYDNMADQWEQGYRDRAARTGAPLDPDGAADLLVVVNAGKSAGWTPWSAGPLLSDVPGLTRTIDILYDVSTSNRRKRLVSAVAPSQLGHSGLGSLVHITTSPLALIERFSAQGTDSQRQRADATRTVVSALASREEWYRVGDLNGAVKTTLGRVPVEDVARLVWHAFVLTWTSVWVIHGVGTPPDPTRLSLDRFRQLCRPTSGGG